MNIPLLRSVLLCVAVAGLALDRANSASPMPPIVKVKAADGRTYRTQTFAVSALDIVLKPLTIAQRHYIWQAFETLPNGPMDVEIKCWVGSSGIAAATNCSVAQSGPETPIRTAGMRLLSQSAPTFPPLSPISEAEARQYSRYVTFAIRLDPNDKPKINLEAGPILETRLFEGVGYFNWGEYPTSALRNNLNGRLTALCQVQTDSSLICSDESFDPPEHFPYFRGHTLRQSLSRKIKPKLTDGTDAAGKRFRLVINFRTAQN